LPQHADGSIDGIKSDKLIGMMHNPEQLSYFFRLQRARRTEIERAQLLERDGFAELAFNDPQAVPGGVA
jgi:hypothetical protein